ncbi:MAG: NADH-quinone oxidoreductase subunit A [Ignavibacteriales bacterium]|jgi:NADH-quinone oxidoreductase subunit A|nr:NADH-quinone oxidoreductase subunit A [Ignavibacteriales bacterium]MBP7543175.1 NADH-quinone oxidoreductase subunit A [Ignavibacteriaceae bacterium]MBP9123048.1 NADH-quinone oxidoreductase subunit A [Ignavibacteriaceae bacterium]
MSHDLQYIVAFILVAVLFSIVALLTAWLLRPNRPTFEKLQVYECGEETQGVPYIKYNVRFYVVALLYLVFGVELVLVIPWVASYLEYGLFGLILGLFFLIILGVGIVYEWKKGDLDWFTYEDALVNARIVKTPEQKKKVIKEEVV